MTLALPVCINWVPLMISMGVGDFKTVLCTPLLPVTVIASDEPATDADEGVECVSVRDIRLDTTSLPSACASELPTLNARTETHESAIERVYRLLTTTEFCTSLSLRRELGYSQSFYFEKCFVRNGFIYRFDCFSVSDSSFFLSKQKLLRKHHYHYFIGMNLQN